MARKLVGDQTRRGIEVELGKTTGNGQYRVLIADDEDNFAELLATVLEQDGRFELLGRARDGKEALELVFALAPDLVLMDIDMPVMDGVEATSRIHRRRPDLPIVAISGLDYSERGLEARLAGAAEYLCKAKLDTDLAGVLGGVLADTTPLPDPRPAAQSPGRGPLPVAGALAHDPKSSIE